MEWAWENIGVGVENVGVLRRAEDLASTYVLCPCCRNQLSSILEHDGVEINMMRDDAYQNQFDLGGRGEANG